MQDDYDEFGSGVWTWLQAWYTTQCNGDWEHGYGVRIETIDNPGWLVEIDLEDTTLANKPHERQAIHRSEHEWVTTSVEGRKYRAACGPLNLGEALYMFRRWAEANDGPDRGEPKA